MKGTHKRAGSSVTPRNEPIGPVLLGKSGPRGHLSGLPLFPAELTKDNLGTCPECLNEYPLLSPDDLRAHITPSGEYCPGSRGAPVGKG